MSPFDDLVDSPRPLAPFPNRHPLLASLLLSAGTAGVALMAAGHAMLALWAATVACQSPGVVTIGAASVAALAAAVEVYVGWLSFERTARHLELVWGVWRARCPATLERL